MGPTGVLVQAKEKCRRVHFYVVVIPKENVLFPARGAGPRLLLSRHRGAAERLSPPPRSSPYTEASFALRSSG